MITIPSMRARRATSVCTGVGVACDAAGGGGGGGGGGGAETMKAWIGFSTISGFFFTYKPAATMAPMIAMWMIAETSAVNQVPLCLSLPPDSIRTSSNIAHHLNAA